MPARSRLALPAIFVLLLLTAQACAEKPQQPDVRDKVRSALDARGLSDVAVDQDRAKGIVYLEGTVSNDADKAAAAEVAQSVAGGQTVANEIMVESTGMHFEARRTRDPVDDVIDSSVRTLVAQLKGADDVKFDVKNQVVTLTGEVPSHATSSDVEAAVKNVPYVRHVVNSLHVKALRVAGGGL